MRRSNVHLRRGFIAVITVAIWGLLGILAPLLPVPTAAAAGSCGQPIAVCDARQAIFVISAFDPVGSAVRIGPNLLVTSRHIVADRKQVTLFLADGSKTTADVVPTDYSGDLILLSSQSLPPGPVLKPVDAIASDQLFAIGADVSLRKIKAYAPGRIILLPLADKPLARLHHTAYNQPGNSGGALVREDGGWVGVIASGGEGRFEAVSTSAVAKLKSRSGSGFAERSTQIGMAVRLCTLKLEKLRAARGRMDDDQADGLDAACRRTGNRQYYDLAAQMFGQQGRTERAIGLFRMAIAQDPQALNSRLGLAVTYHLAMRYEDEIPHLKFLNKYLPKNRQVLNSSIQAGVWAGDKAFARSAFDRLKNIDPRLAVAAERFLNNPPPRPRRR